jgi:hypothetical protein
MKRVRPESRYTAKSRQLQINGDASGGRNRESAAGASGVSRA